MQQTNSLSVFLSHTFSSLRTKGTCSNELHGWLVAAHQGMLRLLTSTRVPPARSIRSLRNTPANSRLSPFDGDSCGATGAEVNGGYILARGGGPATELRTRSD